MKVSRILLCCALGVLAVVLPVVASAACSSPTGAAGDVIFSNATKTMQYCNGSDWVNTGAVIPSAPQTGCTTPTGAAGHVIYNSALGVVQFCNGSNWVDTACAATRSPGGSGCGGSPAGSIKYVAGSVNELQFCDSTNWVAMGYPCGPVVPLNVADVFSTDVWVPTGSSLKITNNIDLSGQGGMVWQKLRSSLGNGHPNESHYIFDSERGNNVLYTNVTDAQSSMVRTFYTDGFSARGWGSSYTGAVAWTFRKAPKFFDVVTYTGNGTVGRTISHNLGVTPGMIAVKRTDTTSNWIVAHRGDVGRLMNLNLTNSSYAGADIQLGDASMFTVGNQVVVNQSGGAYVAYLFAHDDSADGVIQCGSYTGNGSATGPAVTLGWEPQWFIIKQSTGATNWAVFDKQRGLASGNTPYLVPNTVNAEMSATNAVHATATGFQPKTGSTFLNASGQTYIYCAIRAEGS